MEITTIIGIGIAILICIIGIYLMVRKPNDAAPSLETDLHINPESQQPVIPRHVRNLLQNELPAERVEPSLAVHAKDAKASVAAAEQPQVVTEPQETSVEKADDAKVAAPQVSVMAAAASTDVPSVTVAEAKAALPVTDQTATDASAEADQDNKAKVEPTFVVNPDIQPASIEEFDEESSILEVHLHEQQRHDDESELANAEYIISLNLYPNPRKALSGDKALKILMKYGLRFGEMNCFHRYESPDSDSSMLLFSVLRITDEGPAGFDLETLSAEQVKGLAFFLALPHQNVQKGYDSMVSIAGLIARETDGTIYDENNLEFTPQLKEHWRHKAIDYRAGQAV